MTTKERITAWDGLYGRPVAKAAVCAVWELKRLAQDYPSEQKSIWARHDSISQRFGVRDFILRFGPIN
jgi:hypothetical protein